MKLDAFSPLSNYEIILLFLLFEVFLTKMEAGYHQEFSTCIKMYCIYS